MYKKALVTVVLVAALLAFGGAADAAIPKNTLVVGFNTGIFITLDPGVCFEVFPGVVTRNIYSRLVDVWVEDGKFVVVPDLAEKWEMAEDGKTWTFYLRDGLKFANGDPLTAEDVVFSLQRVVKLQKSPAWLFTDVLGLTEESFTAIDEKTVQIMTNGAPPNVVLTNIGNTTGGVLNKKVVLENEKDGDLGEAWLTDNSAGAGPYVLKEWKRNMRVVLVANENYWRGAPPVKTVIIQDIPEPADQFLLLKKGELDVACDLTAEQANELKDAGGDVRIVTTPGQSDEYVGMNAAWGPFKDVRVRQAVKYAIDYDAVINKVRAGFAINNQQFLPVGYFGYVENNPFKQDLEKAKALLAEAGYADGFEVELVTNTSERRKNEAVIVQENLSKIGIKANVTIMQASQMYAKYRQQGINMIVAGWGVDYPDAAALSDPFANHRVKQLAWRLAWLDDHAADLAEAANKELDEEKRAKMYLELTDYWHENGPFAMMYQPVQFWGVRNEVKGAEEAFEGYSVHCNFTRFSK
jgi:peptide/nickel transport system substrate-binding protein